MADEPNTEPTEPTEPQTDPAGDETPPTPEDWYAGLTDDERKAIDSWHDAKVKGLKAALDSERSDRKSERTKLQAQLKDAVAAASGAEKAALEKLQTEMDAANARAEFFADAQAAGVVDPRTAWAAIREYDLHDRRGNPDLDALKAKCPYLFAQPTPPPRTNAGNGAGQQPAPKADFNSNLRAFTGAR